LKEIEAILEDKIPRDVISKRDAGNGRKLDYLETWYVIDRMNEVFGNMGWDSETVEMREIPGQDKATYVAKVRITALVQVNEGNFLKVTKEGTGYGRDKSALNPHEMASKEAESDAFKRAAMKFGKSMGLALYSKDGDFIDETNKTESRSGTETKPVQAKVPTKSEDKKVSREELNKLIRNTAKVAIDMKKIAPDGAKGLVLNYGVESVDALSDTQAREVLAKFEGMVSA
jgi:DNA recombination protein Rad52